MKTFLSLFIIGCFVSGAFAQKPEGVIKKTTVKPVIDGVLDVGVWDNANVYNIDKSYIWSEQPTLGEPGETNWRALWDEDGMYIFITVNDDYWFSGYPSDYNRGYDKANIYLDVNYSLVDGNGPGRYTTDIDYSEHDGHYKIAPTPILTKIDGTAIREKNGSVWAYKEKNQNYCAEYYVPFSSLLDHVGIVVNLTDTIGFDITINDRDPGDVAHADWANSNPLYNMDNCGTITFEGALERVYAEIITLTGRTISNDNGTLQIVASFFPENTTTKALKWTVENKTGRASISSTGVLTAIADGVVTVEANAIDGSYAWDRVDVTISGQVYTVDELNVIKNGNFDEVDAYGFAIDWGYEWEGYIPTCDVIDGVGRINEGLPLVNQYNLNALPDIPYILKLKAWASNSGKANVRFYDYFGSNESNLYGTTNDPGSETGRSAWVFDITEKPTWYTFHVTFDQIKSDTEQTIRFDLWGTGISYLDSISLLSEADYALMATSAAQKSIATFKVYPNPAGSELHLELPGPSTTVAIYNSLGIKTEETVIPGTQHIFDLSRYSKGFYFVKANNEVVKISVLGK